MFRHIRFPTPLGPSSLGKAQHGPVVAGKQESERGEVGVFEVAEINGLGVLLLLPLYSVCIKAVLQDIFSSLLKADRLCVEVSFAACPLCH